MDFQLQVQWLSQTHVIYNRICYVRVPLHTFQPWHNVRHRVELQLQLYLQNYNYSFSYNQLATITDIIMVVVVMFDGDWSKGQHQLWLSKVKIPLRVTLECFELGPRSHPEGDDKLATGNLKL